MNPWGGLPLLFTEMPRGLVSSEVQRQESKERGPEVSKCHRVQTFLVIGVIITLVTSCWTSAFRAPAPAVPSSQQLAAISPGLIIYPPPTRKAGILATPKRNGLYSPSCRELAVLVNLSASGSKT